MQSTVDLAERLRALTVPVVDLDEGLLVSATYDGDKRKAVLKLYDPKAERVLLWEDNTGHKPYCYTRLSEAEIAAAGVEVGKNGVLAIEPVKRRDLLSDSDITVRRITASDPLAIGGSPGSLRDRIQCWEADIKYYENYVYDRGLKMGTYYSVAHGEVSAVEKEVAGEVRRSLDVILSKASREASGYITAWAELLGQPLASFKRIACDIEVANEENRIPDPEIADREVIAVSFYGDKESVVYLLDKGGEDRSLEGALTGYAPTVFKDEASLLRATFGKMMEYPFLLTFNGDDFDLRYLKHRAMRPEIGIKEDEIPISLQRQEASLKHGVHIDLYRFFNNRSVQVYVYNNRYSEHTLNGIAEALLGKEKIAFEGNIAELPLVQLADYCLNDSTLTYELTSANDSLLMKILLVITRIAKMPMNDASRLGVSNWIRSMIFYDHRRLGALIPRPDELRQKGGASSEAVIKGKKYKGGLVIEPKPGIYFGVSVLDFASLYPSIIKVHNLSYETVNCAHEECRSNRVPDTDHWVCTKRNGVESLLIGSLRDLRVGHYKALTKDKALPKESRDLYTTVAQGLKVILNACFTGDTQVVTPEGIKSIKDFRVGDRVINVNPDTLEVEVDKVVAVQSFEYEGDLCHFADKRFVDLMVTPNHRLLTVDGRKSSDGGAMFRTAEDVIELANVAIPKLKGGIRRGPPHRRISMLETARELGAWVSFHPPSGARLTNWSRTLPPGLQAKVRKHGRVRKLGTQPSMPLQVKDRRSSYEIPADKVEETDIDAVEAAKGRVMVGGSHSLQVPARYAAGELASLCGWYVSEGDSHSSAMRVRGSGRVRGETSGITTSQRFGKGGPAAAPHREGMAGLQESPGLRSVQGSRQSGYFKVSSSILNRWVLSHCCAEGESHNAASRRIPDFVFESADTMKEFLASACKGAGHGGRSRYSTVSTRLANDMVVLLSFLGYKVKLSYDDGSRTYRMVFANVSSKLTHSGAERLKNAEVLPFQGTVYCVTTERNHTVIAGRNGRFVPVGQSYGTFGFETFALYCLPVADATAALGRDAITRTIEKSKQEGVSVIYSDSVTGERCVTVMDPCGRVKVVPIEELFNSFDEILVRPDGKETVVPAGWKTLSFDCKGGKTEWKDITAVIRHRTGKKVFRVWDKLGCTRVTEDHSLIADGGSGPVLSKPHELGDKHLVRLDYVPVPSRNETIDIFEVLRPIVYATRYKGREKVLRAHCDGEWVWYSWTNRKNPVKIRRFIKQGSREFRALVELLGAYITEGSSSTPDTTRSRMGASIANSDRGWLEGLVEDYSLVFSNAKASIVGSDRGPRTLDYTSTSGAVVQVQYDGLTHKVQMTNKLSAVLFKAFCGQRSDGKFLPDFIFSAEDEHKTLLLEAMVKGDGSRAFGKAYSAQYRLKDFKYETKSLRLISGLSTLLLQLGVKHTIHYRESKRTYAIATSTSHNLNRRPPRVSPEAYDGYVYDLSVDGFHTFSDSCGGVVLKNTDSLFIENPDKEKVAGVLKWADKELGVELEVDKTYRYVAFSQLKKNYFGVLQDGTADIKGLTGKKSVGGETPILARIDGRATFTTVEAVYREFSKGRRVELVTVSDGLKSLWAPISDATSHRVDDPYLLRTSKGRSLSLSGDHSVFFMDNFGRLHCKETRNVRQGDVLVGARYIPGSQLVTRLDVKETLPETIDRDGALHSTSLHPTTEVPIPRFLAVTEELAELLGIFAADGDASATPGPRSNVVTQSEVADPEVCAALLKDWRRTFGWDMKVYRTPEKRTFHLPVLHAQFFKRLCGGSSAAKRVPDFLFAASLDVIAAYLRGLFSGDGFSDGRRISLASESRTLVEQLSYLLAYFDIDSRMRRRYNRRFKVEHYQISVIGTSSRLAFQKKIGFLQPRFQRVPSSGPRNRELLPVSAEGLVEVKARIVRRLGMTRLRNVKMHDRTPFNVMLVPRYNAVIEALSRRADSAELGVLSNIKTMLNSQDVGYDEVVSVERRPGSCVMYDFKVPTFERFVAGNLPSLLHNSQTPEYLKREFYEMLDVLGAVYSRSDFDQAKARIKRLLTEMVTSLRERKVPLEDLSFNVMMGKSISGYRSSKGPEPQKGEAQSRVAQASLYDGHQEPQTGFSASEMSGLPQHVKAAILLRRDNKEVKAGELISYVKTKGGHGVKPTSQARPEDIDVDKYLEYASSMFDQVLSALDLSFEAVVPKTSLDAFWG